VSDVLLVAETPTEGLPPRNARRIAQLMRTESAPSPLLSRSFSTEVSLLGKRKRKETSIRLVPEGQRYLSGLVFFFIPPDDIAPQRRARITKAREYGATWARDWTEDITHVVADSHLTYADILSFLRVDALPDGVALVNEAYQPDCLRFRYVVDPHQKQYYLKGYDEFLRDREKPEPEDIVLAPPGVTVSQSSDKSLKLKEPKGGPWNYVPPQTTPSQTSGSGGAQRSAAANPAAEPTFGPRPAPEAPLASAPDFGSLNAEDTTASLQAPTATRGDTTSVSFAANQSTLDGLQAVSTPAERGDALDSIIRETRDLQHLPLDDDEEDDAEENLHSSHKRLNLETFACMRGGTGTDDPSGPNARTIQILSEMADYYTRTSDTWRSLGYRKAITVLKRQPKQISTAEEALQLPHIGQRLAAKIEEVVATDRLRRLDSTKADPQARLLALFLGVYGAGIHHATRWIQQGHTSLADLAQRADLTPAQRVGVAHHADLNTRIPRAEVAAIGALITQHAARIDPDVALILGGSYRRGAPDCGDIDVLVTKRGTARVADLAPFKDALLAALHGAGVLVAGLAVGRGDASPTWHGCCVLPAPAPSSTRDAPPPRWRRIDFHLAPASQLGAALLYFTGNDVFNRSIRLLARRRGMRLNQRGLYRDVLRGPGGGGGKRVTEGRLVEGADERRIFEVLGVPWRRPEERIC
jgi:DNA polymerase IV